MLGAFSRWLALVCSSLPHGGWAYLFGCLLCNMLVHGGWCYGTQCYAHCCSRGYPDDAGLASMGFDGRRPFFGLAFVGVIPTFSLAF